MNLDYDLRDLVPAIEAYIASFVKEPVKKEPIPQYKLEAKNYKSVADFVYKKMTINGLVDRSAKLKEDDLKILKILVQNELDRRWGIT